MKMSHTYRRNTDYSSNGYNSRSRHKPKTPIIRYIAWRPHDNVPTSLKIVLNNTHQVWTHSKNIECYCQFKIESEALLTLTSDSIGLRKRAPSRNDRYGYLILDLAIDLWNQMIDYQTSKISVSVMCRNMHPYQPVDSEWSDYSRKLVVPTEYSSTMGENDWNENDYDWDEWDNDNTATEFREHDHEQGVDDIGSDEKQSSINTVNTRTNARINQTNNNDSNNNHDSKDDNDSDDDSDDGLSQMEENETKFDVENEKMVLQTIKCDLENIQRILQQVQDIHKSDREQSSNSLLSFDKLNKCFELLKTCSMIKDIHKNVEENLQSIEVCQKKLPNIQNILILLYLT